MTQRTFFDIDFPQSGRRKIVAGFVGGDITSDGGALLLRSVDKKLKLTQKLAACILDERDQSKVIHSYQQILAQRVHAIACGYEVCEANVPEYRSAMRWGQRSRPSPQRPAVSTPRSRA